MSGTVAGSWKAAAAGAAAVVLVAALAGLAAYLGARSRTDSAVASSTSVATATGAPSSTPPSQLRSFRFEVQLTTTYGNGLCGDDRPFPVLLKTTTGQAAGTGDLPVVPGTGNCRYAGTIDEVLPSPFYEIVHNSSGSVAGTVGEDVYGDGVITIEESGGRAYFK